MRVAAVIERDLRKFSRNPFIMIVGVLLPIVYLIIIGNSFQGQLKHLPVAVVDLDNGPYSRRVMELLETMSQGPKTINIFRIKDEKEAVAMVRKGFCKAAVIIPENFSRDVIRNANPQVGFFLDNTDAISAASLSAIISQSLGYLKVDYIAVRPDSSRPQLRPVELFKKVDYDASLVPGAVIMAIFMGTMIAGAFNLVMDKFLGVHESYLSTPLTKRDITVGVITSGVFITTCMSLIVLIGSMILTGIKLQGGLTSFALLVSIIILSALGLLSMMFIILGRADHPRIVGMLGGFLNVIFFFPSGAIYPIESFPGWLKAFAKINPEAYAVHALKSVILKGADLAAIKNDIVFLVVFTAIMLTIATSTFKRTL